jgi:cytochrome c oxidase subunit III
MAQSGVKHDYHIINPSPWPLIGSISAVLMAVGLIGGLKGVLWVPKGNFMWLAGGLAGIAYTMFGWWRDVIKESKAGDHTPVVQIGLRYGMIMFIASEIMFFVAWFWFFFQMALFHNHSPNAFNGLDDVTKTWSNWPPKGIETLNPWELPLVNTLILLLSGTTITWSHHALQQGHRPAAKIGLFLTILLGAAFTIIQATEYRHILTENLFYSNDAAKAYGSSFFMATGFHGAHVLIGTIFLTVCLIRMLGGDFTPKKHFGFEAAAWYWHFVDVVWLFLFAFIYVLFGGSH